MDQIGGHQRLLAKLLASHIPRHPVQVSETMNMQTASVPKMSARPTYELITAAELAARWRVPTSWIFNHTRERTPAAERIPCVRLGRYCRFEWASPQLELWLEKHRR